MVITGLTRNIVGSVTTATTQTLYSSAFTPRAFALLKTCISQFSRNLGFGFAFTILYGDVSKWS